MFCWHQWDKWKDETVVVHRIPNIPPDIFYSGPGVLTYEKLIQMRVCKKCNKKQTRNIN